MSDHSPFVETLSDLKRWQQMYELLQSFSEKPESVNDTEIDLAWSNYRDSLQTNCESAAEAHLAALSSICYHRPDLMGKMLPAALEPLFMLGFEDVESIIAWAKSYMAKQEPFMGMPDDVAVAWIRATFCNSRDEIDGALHAFLEEL